MPIAPIDPSTVETTAAIKPTLMVFQNTPKISLPCSPLNRSKYKFAEKPCQLPITPLSVKEKIITNKIGV